MKLYGISLCLALVVAVKASEDGLGFCATFLPIKTQGAEDSNINAISSFGELAVVAYDPNTDELYFSCISMKFDSGKKEYIIKYKESGTYMMKNGTYEVKKLEITLPPPFGKVGTTFYDMPDLKDTNSFGRGKMFPMYVGKNEVILKSCVEETIGSPSYSTFVLIPIAKAVENKGCNCPEWKKSIE